MSMNNSNVTGGAMGPFCSEDEISLYDIWQKLVQYKKVFWAVFFITFAIGVVSIFLTPKKCTFSQIVELGRQNGNRVPEAPDLAVKVKKVFFSKAASAYNAQAVQKVVVNRDKLVVIVGAAAGSNADSGILEISINAAPTESEAYKFIFRQVIDSLINETRYLDAKLSSLNTLKGELEGRLEKIRNRAASSSRVISINDVNNNDVNNNAVGMKRRVPHDFVVSTTAIDDLMETTATRLMDQVSGVQAQIDGTYNTRVVSDFAVSGPVGPSKLGLLIMAIIASFFFAFFGVFVTGFVVGLGRTQK